MTPRALLPALAWPVCAWARSHERRIARAGRPLSPHERAIARQVGVVEVDRVRLAVVGAIPFPCNRLLDGLAAWAGLPGPGATDGLTLGHAIYLRAGAAHLPELLAHECRHVQQCEQLGSLAAFLRRYLREVSRHGYHEAPLEIDARRAARAWLLAQQPGPPAAALSA